MRVLLDECLPQRLKEYLPSHEVRTVPDMGWAGTKDPVLLALAETRSDALITVDHGLPAMSLEAPRALIVVVMAARTNRLNDLQPLMPEVVRALEIARNGQILRVPGSSEEPD